MASQCSSGQKVCHPAVISSSASGSFLLYRLALQTVEGAGIQIVSFVALVEYADTPSALG